MILVDTSVWIAHLRTGEIGLDRLLNDGQVLCHPVVIGELALCNLKRRDLLLDDLGRLPQAVVATHIEVMALIDRLSLHGMGIGYIDAHLVASALLSPDASLWTLDKRLEKVAAQRAGLQTF